MEENLDGKREMIRKLSIIMPCYNEINTIQKILRKVLDVQLSNNIIKEIIVVDDFSTDGTREYLKDLYENNVELILKTKNEGKGSAVWTGIKKATGDYIIIQDADLEYNPEDYNLLIQPVLKHKALAVYGSRFLVYNYKKSCYFSHALANKVITLFSNILTNVYISDVETCYKLIKRDLFNTIRLEEKRFGIEPEITAKLCKMKVEIFEVPISYNSRTYGSGKKIGLFDGFEAIWCILKYNLFYFSS